MGHEFEIVSDFVAQQLSIRRMRLRTYLRFQKIPRTIRPFTRTLRTRSTLEAARAPDWKVLRQHSRHLRRQRLLASRAERAAALQAAGSPEEGEPRSPMPNSLTWSESFAVRSIWAWQTEATWPTPCRSPRPKSKRGTRTEGKYITKVKRIVSKLVIHV